MSSFISTSTSTGQDIAQDTSSPSSSSNTGTTNKGPACTCSRKTTGHHHEDPWRAAADPTDQWPSRILAAYNDQSEMNRVTQTVETETLMVEDDPREARAERILQIFGHRSAENWGGQQEQ